MTIDISNITLENISKYESDKIRKCPICYKEFEATYRKQITCSKKCYYKYRRKEEDKQ